jgi:hypothetical protein
MITLNYSLSIPSYDLELHTCELVDVSTGCRETVSNAFRLNVKLRRSVHIGCNARIFAVLNGDGTFLWRDWANFYTDQKSPEYVNLFIATRVMRESGLVG